MKTLMSAVVFYAMTLAITYVVLVITTGEFDWGDLLQCALGTSIAIGVALLIGVVVVRLVRRGQR